MRNDRGEIRASRIAANREAIRVDAKFGSVGMGPARCLDAIAEASWERVLRRQSIVDAQHRLTAAVRERPADVVVAVEVTDDPAAAVEEDEETRQGVSRRW